MSNRQSRDEWRKESIEKIQEWINKNDIDINELGFPPTPSDLSRWDDSTIICLLEDIDEDKGRVDYENQMISESLTEDFCEDDNDLN